MPIAKGASENPAARMPIAIHPMSVRVGESGVSSRIGTAIMIRRFFRSNTKYNITAQNNHPLHP